MTVKNFPYIDEKLIQGLLDLFPNTLPVHSKDITITEVYRLLGQQDVIHFLQQQLLKQGV